MKRVLAMLISVALVATLAVGGSIAYLTDTDGVVNVMTVGNVDIEQLENGKEEGGFAQGAALYPSYYEDDIDFEKDPGVLDKEVTVKNTGTSAAYVRTWFAFEAGNMTADDFHEYILLNMNDDETTSPWDWEWDPSKTPQKIGDVKYYLAIATLKEALPVGETTEPSLKDVAMSKYAENKHTEPLDGEYTVLALSQAMQTINFEDKSPAEALNIGFNSRKTDDTGNYVEGTDFTQHPWLNGVDMPEGFTVPGTTIRLVKADTPQQGGIIYLHSTDDFCYLNTLIEDWYKITESKDHDHYYYQQAWKVVLNCDVDLKDEENWTPVNIGTFGGFDGKNHTISNLTISSDEKWVGLFSSTHNNDSGKCPISNLVIDDANVTGGEVVGVVVGWGTTPISNVTVKNATVNGIKYAGGIVGKAQASLTNCSVSDSTVTASTKEVGGIVGFLDIGETNRTDAYVTNCSVEKTTVEGSEEVGGIIGRAFARDVNGVSTITISGCSVSDVTVTATDANTTYYGDILGRDYDETGVSINDSNAIMTVGDADSLVEALENGKDVVLTNDVKIDPAGMSNAYGTTGINVKNGQTIDGGNNTLDIKGAGGTWDSGINTTGGTIKNITVTGSFRGIFINHNSSHSEPVVLENVTIDGTTYTISCDQGMNQNLEATNSTFNGWTSYAATLGTAKFTNCSFGEGNGFAYCRPYAPTEFDGCKFEAGYRMDARAAVTFKNCTIGGVALTAENLATLVVSNIANATVK